MKNILLIAIFSLLLITGCKKKEETQEVPQMPPYTETGANTAAYKVDGEIVIPATEGLFSNKPIDLVLDLKTHYFWLTLNKQISNQKTRVLDIRLNNLNGKNHYMLNSQYYDALKNSGYFRDDNSEYFTYDDNINTGNLIVTKFDTIKKILSGRFAFKAYNFNTNKVVNISEGQFDITY